MNLKVQDKIVINSTFLSGTFLGNTQYSGYLGPFLKSNHLYLWKIWWFLHRFLGVGASIPTMEYVSSSAEDFKYTSMSGGLT